MPNVSLKYHNTTFRLSKIVSIQYSQNKIIVCEQTEGRAKKMIPLHTYSYHTHILRMKQKDMHLCSMKQELGENRALCLWTLAIVAGIVRSQLWYYNATSLISCGMNWRVSEFKTNLKPWLHKSDMRWDYLFIVPLGETLSTQEYHPWHFFSFLPLLSYCHGTEHLHHWQHHSLPASAPWYQISIARFHAKTRDGM